MATLKFVNAQLVCTINRRWVRLFIAVIGWLLSLGSMPVTAVAAPRSSARILVIVSSNSPFYEPATKGFRDGLAQREVANDIRLTFDTLTLTGVVNADRHNIDQRLHGNPDLICAIGSDAVLDLVSLHSKIPAVFCMILNPVSLGAASTVQKPGGEFTGTTLLVDPGKQLETLQIADPAVKRIGVLYTADDPTSTSFLAMAASEARSLNIALVTRPVKSDQDIGGALKSMAGKVDAMWIIADPMSTDNAALTATANFTHSANIPMLGLSPITVAQGALIALSPNYQDLGDVTAEMAASILSGLAVPATTQVRGPRATILTVNIGVAANLKLTLPADLLHLADQVIQRP